MMIALSDIEPIMCARCDLTRVYVSMLVQHRRPPPIKLISQENERYPFNVYDGHHRVAAHRYIGAKKIKAEIVAMPEITE